MHDMLKTGKAAYCAAVGGVLCGKARDSRLWREGILKACAKGAGAIHKAKEVHDEISRQGLLEHDIVLS